MKKNKNVLYTQIHHRNKFYTNKKQNLTEFIFENLLRLDIFVQMLHEFLDELSLLETNKKKSRDVVLCKEKFKINYTS